MTRRQYERPVPDTIGGPMSTELRRVPPNWEHPTDHKTSNYESSIAYQAPRFKSWRPLLDEDWAHAARRWWLRRIGFAIKRGLLYPLAVLGIIGPDWSIAEGWDKDDTPPDYFRHRPRWKRGEATHYQLYETVSEGTPISPVCSSIDQLIEWCASQSREVWVGTATMSRDQWVRFFAQGGYSPSGIFTPATGFVPGIVAMSHDI